MKPCKPCGIPSTVLEVNTTYHSNLLGLDDENQHPVKSIIGLEEHLSYLDASTEALDGKIDSNVEMLDGKIDSNVETLDNKIDNNVETLNETINSDVEELNGKIDLKQNKITLQVEGKTLIIDLNN